jgi:hypothetical protein
MEVNEAIAKLLPGIVFHATDWKDSAGVAWRACSLFTFAGAARTLWFKDDLLVSTDAEHGEHLVTLSN